MIGVRLCGRTPKEHIQIYQLTGRQAQLDRVPMNKRHLDRKGVRQSLERKCTLRKLTLFQQYQRAQFPS